MKQYPAYKDSGVEWIGEIPDQWDTQKLKYLVRENLKYGANESAILEDKNLPRYLRISDFNENGKLRKETFKSLPFEKAKDYILKNGDILFARSGATVGKTFQYKSNNGQACFAGYLIKASPSPNVLSSDFLYYFTQSNNYENWKNSIFIQATIQNIGADKYNNIFIPVPSIREQEMITNYLDYRTAQIDDLIAKKQRMINLLQEERAAVINQAVTKGLNPDVRMKDSGIEWLGEIPAHWEVKKLKYVTTKIGSGITPKGGAAVYQNEGIPFLRSQNIHFSGIRLEDVAYISEEIHTSMSTSKVGDNDVLLNITGASIGRCAYVSDNFSEANVNQHVCILRPNNKIDKRFLNAFLSSEKGQFQIFNGQKGISREGLNFEQIKLFQILLPSKVEQKNIIRFLSNETEKIEKAVFKIKKEIQLLQEYRIALISEVVTGKIDVREKVIA